jgi:glycolate oxidase iron-sulfur subunit
MTEGKAATADDLLTSCVHCGFCLEVCPTYRLTGDENNSPRGRLRLWREEAQGTLQPDPWTGFYTTECVGCLACEPACPANVPYGAILEQTRREHVAKERTQPGWRLRVAAWMAARPRLARTLFAPVRALRHWGLVRHPFVFAGQPSVVETTANYAQRLMRQHQPTGPKVALLTGCVMESVFREINFATIRVLIANNVQVVVPEGQTCCGAFQNHAGLPGSDELTRQNASAFALDDVAAILTNAAGCGLQLQHAGVGTAPVLDVTTFLAGRRLRTQSRRNRSARVYVDLPCHLVHGQRVELAASVLDATGYQWELAPGARDCCGSGGIYNIQKPENAREILAGKSAFLNTAPGDPVILATTNPVCMMQWNSARALGLVTRPYLVCHLLQLLDPGEELTVDRSNEV